MESLSNVIHIRTRSFVESEKPARSFDQAKLHFVSTLPHRIADETQPDGYRLALTGERTSAGGERAMLYDSIWTAPTLFGEFGIGITLYFEGVKALGLVFLACSGIAILSVIANSNYNTKCPRFLVGSTCGVQRNSKYISYCLQ